MQVTYNPADYNFRWTDGWYEWDRTAAVRAALADRRATAAILRSQGVHVRQSTLRNQRITRGGIGTGHPQIELVTSVYMLNAREAV